jgi:hypothetical protein
LGDLGDTLFAFVGDEIWPVDEFLVDLGMDGKSSKGRQVDEVYVCIQSDQTLTCSRALA